MHSLRFVLFTALVCFALLNPAVSTYSSGCDPHKPNLFDALIKLGLKEYAKFLRKYAPELATQPKTLIYAPNDAAVRAYLAANPQPGGYGYKQIRDVIKALSPRAGPSPGANSAAKGNTGTVSSSNSNFGALPPRGSTSGGGTSSAKVSKSGSGGRRRNTMRYVGTLTSGGGGVAKVLKDAQAYNCGYIFELDSFTSVADTFEKTIQDPKYAYFLKIMNRISAGTRQQVFSSHDHTFFLPTLAALKAAGLNPDTAPTNKLEKFVKDHCILNNRAFIGYTPGYQNGVCYKVLSGKGFRATLLGIDTKLNNAKIVSPDIITDKGCIQQIDKVLFQSSYDSC